MLVEYGFKQLDCFLLQNILWNYEKKVCVHKLHKKIDVYEIMVIKNTKKFQKAKFK